MAISRRGERRQIHLTFPDGGPMRYSILTAAMLSVVALLAIGTHAQDMGEEKAETQTLTGILIDTHCGAGMDEAKASKHTIACATKEACAKSGYELVVGD